MLGLELVTDSPASSIRLRRGKYRPKSLLLSWGRVWEAYEDPDGLSWRCEDRLEDLFRLGGESSISIQSDEVDRPCSWDTALGPAALRLLLTNELCPLLFAASSAGLETISFGGTGGEACPAVSD